MPSGRCTTLVLSAVLASGAGCAADPPAAAPRPEQSSSPAAGRERLAPPTGTLSRFPAYSATATTPSVVVRSRPGGPVTHRLAHPQASGAPLTFLLKGRQGGAWLEVFLPVRPNGSSGWVSAADVELRGVAYRVDVLRGRHLLRLYDRDRLAREIPVGIGTSQTPTPGGTYYLKELLRPTNRSGAYGPYAYGLSGFSNALRSYGGGDGVIGIHGTDDPGSIGQDVSHGCIRMSNADITYLARLLPLGTPVRILA